MLVSASYSQPDRRLSVCHAKCYAFSVANFCASSRRLILPRSFTGISSTKKICFGTCQPLSRRRQNSKHAGLGQAVGQPRRRRRLPDCAGSIRRPKTTACLTPAQRSSSASISAGFTFFPATLITSETRPTMRKPRSVFRNKSSGMKKPPPSFSSFGLREVAISNSRASHAHLARLQPRFENINRYAVHRRADKTIFDGSRLRGRNKSRHIPTNRKRNGLVGRNFSLKSARDISRQRRARRNAKPQAIKRRDFFQLTKRLVKNRHAGENGCSGPLQIVQDRARHRIANSRPSALRARAAA